MSKKDLFEIGATQSSSAFDAHNEFIHKMTRKGYTIQSQKETEEKGLDMELIARQVETILSPPISALPFLKLQAKEIFGNYSFREESFSPYPHPKFELTAYKRGGELHEKDDPWDLMDLNL